jgi:hypothetical protein
MAEINYQIGQYCQYPDDRKMFKLVSVNGWVFTFECGHMVTDLVFQDMVNCETGIQVYKDIQLNLF